MTNSLKLALQTHDLPGKLIIFCGVDGTGKSTLTEFAIKKAKLLGRKAIQVGLLDDFIKEAPSFRDYAHHPAASIQRVDLLALSLVCAGSRLQNLKTLVLPELAAGSWVFCDRYIYTTWAEFAALSQATAEREILRKVLEVFPRADLGFLPYASAEVCIERVSKREEEMSKVLDAKWYTNLISTYRAVAIQNRLKEICTERPQSECEALIENCLATLQQREGLKGGRLSMDRW